MADLGESTGKNRSSRSRVSRGQRIMMSPTRPENLSPIRSRSPRLYTRSPSKCRMTNESVSAPGSTKAASTSDGVLNGGPQLGTNHKMEMRNEQDPASVTQATAMQIPQGELSHIEPQHVVMAMKNLSLDTPSLGRRRRESISARTVRFQNEILTRHNWPQAGRIPAMFRVRRRDVYRQSSVPAEAMWSGGQVPAANGASESEDAVQRSADRRSNNHPYFQQGRPRFPWIMLPSIMDDQ